MGKKYQDGYHYQQFVESGDLRLMKRRILLLLSITCVLIFSSSIPASAAVGVDADEMAVYLNHGFDGRSSAIVDGSIYSANGNVQFDSSLDNNVTGSIYHHNSKQFIIPAYYTPDFMNRVVALENTNFEGAFPELAAFPAIGNYVASEIPSWGAPALTVSENTHFGTLVIRNGMTVDVNGKDIYLVVDNLKFEWGQSITLNGDGRLFLFIQDYNSAGGPIGVNNGNNPDRTYIVSKKSISHNNLDIYAHVYYDTITDLILNGKITGSVVTNAATLQIDGGGKVVKGLVYAPNAAATIKSPGTEPGITGRIVADSLALKNSGRIVYDPAFASLTLPPQLLKHEVTVSANIPAGGTVSPAYKKAGYGEVVNISATPNPGYLFTGFTSSSSSMIPDVNGNITVTGSVNLTANFELAGEYVNGLLGEYYDTSEFDNESALRMKRIDSSIAHNYMYDSPHPVIEPETFAIRWTGYIRPQVSGAYTFKTYSDDGIIVTVNNDMVIDNWGSLSLAFTVADHTVYLEAGHYYPITVEYQQLPLYAASFLFWEANGVPMSLVPESAFFVSQTDYNEYVTPKFYHELEKAGEGFHNVFYALNAAGTERIEEYTEVNSIDYSWGSGAPENITKDVFYGEMEGYLEARFTESTTLQFMVDDGIRVWVGDENGDWFHSGNPVIDEWDWHSVDTFEYTFDTIAGHKYKIRIEYVDLGIGATCVMRWKGAALGYENISKKYMYTD